jgi:hypothetical protein
MQSPQSILRLLVTLSARAAQSNIVGVSRNFSVQKRQFLKGAPKNARTDSRRENLRCHCKSGRDAGVPAVALRVSRETIAEMKRVSGFGSIVDKDGPVWRPLPKLAKRSSFAFAACFGREHDRDGNRLLQ